MGKEKALTVPAERAAEVARWCRTKEKCDYLLPPSFGYIAGSSVNDDGDLSQERPECLLVEGHDGPHLCRFSDGAIIEWEPDSSGECGCTGQEMEDGECECFVYWAVSAAHMVQRLKKNGPQE